MDTTCGQASLLTPAPLPALSVDTSHALRWSIRHVVSQWDFVCFLHEAHAEKRLPALDGIAGEHVLTGVDSGPCW